MWREIPPGWVEEGGRATLTGDVEDKPRKVKRKPRRREWLVQAGIVAALRIAGFEPIAINIELPLPGKAGAIAGAQRKRMGARAGVPEVVVPLERGRCLWMEVKTQAEAQGVLRRTGVSRARAGRVSDMQLMMHDILRRLGHEVVVVRSVEDALAVAKAAQARVAA